MPRIGYLILSPLADPPSAERQAFLNGLRDLGYLPEVAGKRLALVKEALPKVSRVGVLWNPASESVQPDWQATQTAAGVLGITLQSLEVRDPKDFPSAFAAMARRRPDALIIFFSPLMRAYRPIIVELATKNRLPTMLGERADVEEGVSCRIRRAPPTRSGAPRTMHATE